MKALLLVALVACGRSHADHQVGLEVRLPRAPGALAPSFATVEGAADGTVLADVDSCATCHPDVAAQWSSSAHSFASFGNPIYRANVEMFRGELGKTPSLHCGGCHDMPLVVDGLMTGEAAIPPADLRSHSGVTCRLCHGIQSTTHDGNGSYVWNATPLDAPALDDAGSIARHKREVTTKVDTELCVGCHRGFLSPDLTMPVHLTGIDEPGQWRNSAYTGNGMGRVDKVEKRDCIGCHMERVAAGTAELGAKQGTVASHRFLGGHTWMAAMRDDAEQLRLTRAKLEGVASIDVAGARGETWTLPADGAPLHGRIELDVVIRNLLVGHRFPGGVLDIQDTWIEVEVTDRGGKRIASSGLAHELDASDDRAHVLRTIVVDEHGDVLEEHEMAKFRTQVATKTLAAREAQAVRYVFETPPRVMEPVTVVARLRHRSRSLKLQAAVCREAKTATGRAFAAGGRGARDVTLDPCKPQPITLIAETRAELGRGAKPSSRPAWERMYEHGMALVASLPQQLGEARYVLERALAAAPDPRAQAMVRAQLGWVASRQNRVDDALAEVTAARALLGADPPVFDAIVADAYMRMNRYADAIPAAWSCTQRAPQNWQAWSVYARALVAAEDYLAGLAAARSGLALAPRDPALLSAQATALAALGDPQAPAAQQAYTRFRAPDEAPGLRIRCARGNAACARDRNPVHVLPLE